VESLFGNQMERARAALEGIIYAKTNDYKFESEYRLAIPLGEGEEDLPPISKETNIASPTTRSNTSSAGSLPN